MSEGAGHFGEAGASSHEDRTTDRGDGTSGPVGDSGPEQGVVVLTRGGVKRMTSGHPWLYPDQIAEPSTRDGEVVRLEGPVGRVRGAATFSLGSRIPLRVVSRDAGDLPGEHWWRERLDRAVARREQDLPEDQNACRWVHSEADGLPGLVVDRVAEVAVVQAGCRWADRVAGALAKHLIDTTGVTGVLARHDGPFRTLDGLEQGVQLLAGEVPEQVLWQHGGLTRTVDPWHGQKTGAYLDQRENQLWAAQVLPVGRCLDAFCHEGGFGLHLAAAGSQVDALDSSQPALKRARANAEANGLGDRFLTKACNVFEELRSLRAASVSYDGIVLDPPALAKRKQDVPSGLRAYKDLALQALRLLRPGGRLLACSCSFHVGREEFLDALRAAAADARRDVHLQAIRSAASCHPRLITYPESDYLKVVLMEVQPPG